METKESNKQNCGNCLHNIFNICRADYGYYFNGEAISDEEVECEDFIMNENSYGSLLKMKR
ncbi:MAG TPA: hypothetical protein DCY20_10020 [Firmicutes bacterium]|nr:hypothetical protein [Bacillota bacterium]